MNKKLKQSFISLVLLGGSVVLQSTLLQYVAIGGVKPDLSIVILVFIAIRTGSLYGSSAGFVTGIIEDFISFPPLGFYAFIRTVIGFLYGLLQGAFYIDSLFMPVLLILAATVIKGLLGFLISIIFSISFSSIVFFGAKFWVEVGYNALIAPFCFALLNLIKLYKIQEKKGRALMGEMLSIGSQQQRRSRRVRFLTFSTIIVSCFFLLFIYLFYLQVISAAKYQKKAKEVASRSIAIPARRGEIYDRNRDIPLATNVDSFAVDLIPGNVPRDQIDEVFMKLAQLLEMDLEDVRSIINKRFYRNFQPFEIKDGVAKETVYYLAEHIQDYPGVTWHSKAKRSYLEKNSLAHVLGYVDTITTEELQVLYNRGYSFDARIGKSGIEKIYDEALRGTNGRRINIVDVKGKEAIEKAETTVLPEPGDDIVLTIDRSIQTLSEKALGDRTGSIVVLKPATGEILAMVSHPWFDPSIFATEGTSSDYREFALDPTSPFLNRTVQSAYPPASVFKIVLTTAVVEEGAFPLNQEIECEGEMRLGDRVFHDWKEYGHGSLNLIEALAQSCDIFFYNMGLELGPEIINQYAFEYGLGSSTGIDLPGEVAGFIPTPEWKEQKYHMKWLGGDTLNLSIGQAWALATPVQLANMVAMVVNEGVIYKPHLLKEIRDPVSGDIIHQVEREVLHTSFVSESTYHFLQKAMRKVVIDGTGRGVITTKAVESAGKTGTAEIGLEDNYHSWYVGYAPYLTDVEEERVVVVVMVEADPEGYEWWSPKACNAILQGIFAKQSYEEAADSLNLWYLKQNGNNP